MRTRICSLAGFFRATCGLLSLSLLSACVTKREAKGDVRTTYGFDPQAWGGKAGKDDSEEIRSKFAESGWTIDESGQFRADNERNANLYRGKAFGKGREFEKTDAHLSKREVDTKAFRTPEYLERQQYQTRQAKGVDGTVREGAFDEHRATESGHTAKTGDKPGILAGLNPFRSVAARETNQAYRTSADRATSRAQENAVTATGVNRGELGYSSDPVSTMDDVKRLLHPEKFD